MIELLLEAESALSLGLLDRAEILYRQVAGADPRNSIAVVGLARVMLERGDEPGALKQARRALAIDAENTAAQRMVQRLEEVLEYRRSESVPTAEPHASRSPVVSKPSAAMPAPSTARSAAAPRSAALATAPEPTGAPTPSSAEPPVAAPAAVEEPPMLEPPRSRSIVDRLLRRR